MNCSEAEILIHALLDGELDAGHMRDVEGHLAGCAECSKKLAAFRGMRRAITEANLKETAPLSLRGRIEESLPAPAREETFAAKAPHPGTFRPSRRSFAGGFATGAILSAAVATTLALGVFRSDQDQLIAAEVVSAHLRSLQPGHLTDVETSDQHTVKPWFNGKLDVAPPVVDLAAQGFMLVGGRLDDINDEAVAAIVYRRRNHVVNLFIAQQPGGGRRSALSESHRGFNIRYWSEGGLGFWAVSDLNGAELDEFCQNVRASLPGPSAAPDWLRRP